MRGWGCLDMGDKVDFCQLDTSISLLMEGGLLIAILAGIGGMLGWGFADFFAKKTIDQIGDVPSLAWGHVFGSIALFLAMGYQYLFSDYNLTSPNNGKIWAGLVFFGVLQAMVYLFVYKGFEKGHVSVLSPVFGSFAGITAILSIAVFREPVGIYLIAGLVILFLGIILINTDLQAIKNNKWGITHVPGFKEILIAAMMAGLWTLFWDKFVGGQDWLTYTFYMYLFMTITIILFAIFNNINLKVSDSSIWKFLVLIGVTEVIAYVALSWGYSSTLNTSVIALLSGAFSLPVIILARIFLKEKITHIQTIGSIVVIIGIILVSVL